MSNTNIVVESGDIRCVHGGKVILVSSQKIHTIGGQKPIHVTDFLGASISGCPKKSPCTKVASISSAVTEHNVSAAGLKYLLRTDGSKTNKGAALVLNSPGQFTHKIKAKSSESAGKITHKVLEDAVVEKQINTEKELYHVYPLRESSKLFRPLRGTRKFNLKKDYYHVDSSNYSHDKILTMTEAYLYVTCDDGEPIEYKVINNGSYYEPDIQDISFKNTATEVERGYIPFYKESGKMEIVYSNIRLSTSDLANFTPKTIKIGDSKNNYVEDPQNFSKHKKHTKKSINNVYLSQKEAKKLQKKHLNIVVYLEDLIGEVEDLYNDLEFSFHLASAYNKPFIDRVKKRNAYAYSVANFMDELELNSKEKQEREETKEKLKNAYHTLVEGLKEEFLPYVIDTCRDRKHLWSIKDSNSSFIRLNAFIEYDVAMSYLNDVKLNASFLLKLKTKHEYGDMYDEYSNGFDGRRTEHLKETCFVDNKNGIYLCLGKTVRKYNYETGKFTQLSTAEAQYKEKLRKDRAKVTALTLFSLYFSGKHDISLKGKYKDAAEEFHYNLKKLKAHPEFDEDIQDEINEKFDDSAYTKLFKNENGVRSDTFIDDYENIEITAKECAFSWETKNKTQLEKFATMIPDDETFGFYYEEKLTSTKEYSKQLKKKLEASELKTRLEEYMIILGATKDKDEIIQILNIGYSLTASRTMFDEEVNDTSPFNPKSGVRDFLIYISQRLQAVEASEHEALYKEQIFQLYHKNLHALILHALVKGVYNEDGFSNRQANVTKKFLDVLAPQSAKEYPLDLANLNDGNIDKELLVKKAHEKLFEQLKALDGITSQIHGAEDKQREKEKTNNANDGLTTKVQKTTIIKQIRNSKPYKITIPALKGLSFFVALYQTGKVVKDYQKMTVSSLLELSASINVMAKVTGEAAQATELLSTSAKAQYIFSAMKEEKFLFQRALTKLAIPIVVFGAYNEIASLDDEDYDATVAISVKTGLTIGLMLFATGIGEILIIGIAIELLWMMFSSYFKDSRVEVMIEKSLFYQDGRKAYILESLSSDGGEYLDKGSSKRIQDITLSQKPKDVRDFIYANYKDHKKELNAAFSYEMSSIFAALKGVNIEKSRRSKQYKSSKATYAVCSYISISKEFYKDIKRIVLLEDDKEIEIDISKHKLKNDKEYIDILTHMDISNSSILQEYPKKDTKLLLHSDTISLKYDVTYYYDDASKYLARATGGALKIIDLKSLPLTKDDCKILNIQVS